MKEKLLLIGPLPPPIGGDTISFSRLVENEYLKEFSKDVVDTSRKGNIRLTGRKSNFRDLKNGIRVINSVLKKIKQSEVVLIWANSRFLYTVGLILILITKMNRKKLICKMFGGTFDESFEKLPYIYKTIARNILGKSDYILPQTRKLCDYFTENLKIECSKVVHFPNYIPSNVIDGELSSVNLDRMDLKCIFIGQVKREKGVFDILEMLKVSPNIQCDFYGPLLERDKDLITNELEKMDNAQYKGILKPEDVCKIIEKYNILLLPTFHNGEGYPAVILEAFSKGRPVLATKWKSLPELVGDGVEGFLVPINSPKDIKQKLEVLRCDENLYNKMCNNAMQKAKLYTEKKVIVETLLPLIKNR